jgi:hypothetical protein
MSDEHGDESSASRPGSPRSPLQAMKDAAARLQAISERLATPDLPDDEAEALAREAAELAARGGVLLDERLREVADEGGSTGTLGPDG